MVKVEQNGASLQHGQFRRMRDIHTILSAIEQINDVYFLKRLWKSKIVNRTNLHHYTTLLWSRAI